MLIKFWNSRLQDVTEPNRSEGDETNAEGRCGDATEHDRDRNRYLALPACQLARVGGHGNARPS